MEKRENKKKKWEKPELKIVEFDSNDIIVTSYLKEKDPDKNEGEIDFFLMKGEVD